MAAVDASRRAAAAGPSPDATLEGPAFPLAVKLLATALVAGIAWYGVNTISEMSRAGISYEAWLLMSIAGAAVAVLYYWILKSRTQLDATHLRQTWIWPKSVPLVDITRVKVIYVPGLAWLIAPRLRISARGKGQMVFHMADRTMLLTFVHNGLKVHPTAR